MVAAINSAGIFWLLPMNVIFFALAMYNAEHVSVPSQNRYFIISRLSSNFYFVNNSMFCSLQLTL